MSFSTTPSNPPNPPANDWSPASFAEAADAPPMVVPAGCRCGVGDGPEDHATGNVGPSEQPPVLSPPARRRPDRLQRTMFAWALAASVLLCIALAGPFLAGRAYTANDLGALHLPTRAFFARQLARGEPFDWMPEMYAGFYLTGEGQAGMYHPVHWFLYRTLPLGTAMAGELLLTYPFLLVGTWLFLRRRVGRSDGAMLGGLLFAFGGFNLLHFMHVNMVAVLAHLPWLLWAIDVVLTDPRRRRVAWAQVAIALLTASQLLLGHPQALWTSLVAEAAFALWILVNIRRLASTRGPGNEPAMLCGFVFGRATRLVVAKLIGLLLGAVQLLPTADALAHSARHATGAAFADSGSLHPLNLVQLVAPYLFSMRVAGQNTHELGLYAGAVPLLLAVWMVARWRRLGRLRPLAIGVMVFGLIALLAALGKYGPVYRLQHLLPLVGGFRFPARYLALFQLALAVAAAMGFILLIRDHRRSRRDATGNHATVHKMPWRRFTPLAAIVLTSIAAVVLGRFWREQPWMAPLPLALVGPGLLVVAGALMVLVARGSRAALVGLILLAAADLGVYGLSYAVYPHTMPLDEYLASIPTPPASGPGRVTAYPVRFDEETHRMGNQITMLGYSRADGYASLDPRRRLDYRRVPALRAAGVQWMRRSPDAERIEGLVVRDAQWLEIPDPLPRVRLVTDTLASDNPARDIERIALESTALVEETLSLPGGPPGTIAPVDDRPGRLRVECDCPSRQLLVFAETFHPGWQATVDGRPWPVLRVNGDFMGVEVGPGSRRIDLAFRPKSLADGWQLTCLGLALCLGCLVFDHRRAAEKK